MTTLKLSSKNQIVIPREARETLQVKAGDEFLCVTRRGLLYLVPKPKSFVEALRGTARGKLRFPKNYLKRERASW